MAAATATAQCLHKVFVYGTLKRGQPNHHLLENPAKGSVRFLGEARTHDKFPLVIYTEYNIPFLLDAPGQGNHVLGDMFAVDDQMLATLDDLENTEIDVYSRVDLMVTPTGASQPEKCSSYVFRNFKPAVLSPPFYEYYDSFQMLASGLSYVKPKDRVKAEGRDPLHHFKDMKITAAD